MLNIYEYRKSRCGGADVFSLDLGRFFFLAFFFGGGAGVSSRGLYGIFGKT
jgi:hypothetical protein